MRQDARCDETQRNAAGEINLKIDELSEEITRREGEHREFVKELEVRTNNAKQNKTSKHQTQTKPT